MLNKLQDILKTFKDKVKNIKNKEQLEEIKREYTGKESPLNDVLKSMRELGPEEKKEAGSLANNVKIEINTEINKLADQFSEEDLKKVLEQEKIDLSMPGVSTKLGTIHPLNLVIDEIYSIFSELGFEMVNGTEFELDEFNFQKLNLPKDHPARDMQDTFYINDNTVLRTHATNMTARMLTELSQKPLNEQYTAAVSYGNVYRRDDDDATHSHQFMQIDGFVVGDKISFANLKWILEYMCQRLFNEKTQIRLRPSYFPFTEPSVEVDVTCVTCEGSGCSICKQTGYIEILGAGMINPNVMTLNGLGGKNTTGLAFGIGIERIAMLKFGIKNIRDFYENDIRFLEQFKYFGN